MTTLKNATIAYLTWNSTFSLSFAWRRWYATLPYLYSSAGILNRTPGRISTRDCISTFQLLEYYAVLYWVELCAFVAVTVLLWIVVIHYSSLVLGIMPLPGLFLYIFCSVAMYKKEDSDDDLFWSMVASRAQVLQVVAAVTTMGLGPAIACNSAVVQRVSWILMATTLVGNMLFVPCCGLDCDISVRDMARRFIPPLWTGLLVAASIASAVIGVPELLSE